MMSLLFFLSYEVSSRPEREARSGEICVSTAMSSAIIDKPLMINKIALPISYRSLAILNTGRNKGKTHQTVGLFLILNANGVQG